ncbi:MAG: GAF domain-containing protein, partial [Anaerolineales bacterium]
IPPDETEARLPAQLTARVQLAECAILPINAGRRVMGLMLVDNKHNHHRLNERSLDRLQTILNYAGLVWETLRQRKKSDALLDANYQILGSASKDALKKTLTRICQTARAISEADWAIIYPLKQGEDGFDRSNISYDGVLKYPLEETVKEKPRKRGVSKYVIDNGELVVHDINDDQTLIDAHRLAEHHFIQREGVQSLIGVAIADVTTGEKLGVLYLDYRQPRTFTDQEIHHAHSFASLAGVAIVNARRLDQERQRKHLQAALETAKIVSKSITLDDMLTKVLDNLSGLFKGAAMCVLTYYPEENALRFVPGTLKYYRSDYTRNFGERPLPLSGQSIACRLARETRKKKQILTHNEPDVSRSKDYLQVISKTRSELCVSLVDSEKNLLGVLALERPVPYGFDDGDEALIRLIATQVSLGIERIRINEDLDYSNTVSALTAWAADIAHEIKSEVGIIKDSAYLIREFAGNHPDIIENLDEIEKSAEKLSLADPQKSKPKQELLLDDLLKKFGQELAQEKEVEVHFELRARDYYIKVNPLVFRRMLRHLFSNAARAMEAQEQKQVHIRSKKFDATHVEFQFRDFGSGIPDHIRNDLFRKKTTTKKGGEGGHGLLFCRQAVEEMGGKIRLLRTAPGQGATFSIVLPIHQFTESLPE